MLIKPEQDGKVVAPLMAQKEQKCQREVTNKFSISQ